MRYAQDDEEATGIERSIAEFRARLPKLSVDFHGVICAHPEGSKGATEPDWPEVPCAIDWLKMISEHYNIVLVSARFSRRGDEGPEAARAAKAWLIGHGIPPVWLALPSWGIPRIGLAAMKIPCMLLIDDRALTFRGHFPSLEEISSFKPWNR